MLGTSIFETPETLEHDIALGTLEVSLYFNTMIQPIKLPKMIDVRLQEQFGRTCQLYGWGLTRANDLHWHSNALTVAEMTIRSDDECTMEAKDNPDYLFKNSAFCALGIPQPMTMDSGGPLICKVFNRKVWLGSHIAGSINNTFGIYASIPFHLSWINAKLDELRSASNMASTLTVIYNIKWLVFGVYSIHNT